MKLSFKKSRGLWDSLGQAVKKIFFSLALNVFLVLLVFFLLNISFGAFLFYKYTFLMNNSSDIEVSMPTKFKENIYQSVLMERQKREAIFNNTSPQNYSDPFQ